MCMYIQWKRHLHLENNNCYTELIIFLIHRVKFAQLFLIKRTLLAKYIVSQPPSAVTLLVRRDPAGIPREVTNVAVLQGMLGKTVIEVKMSSCIPKSQPAFSFFVFYVWKFIYFCFEYYFSRNLWKNWHFGRLFASKISYNS